MEKQAFEISQIGLDEMGQSDIDELNAILPSIATPSGEYDTEGCEFLTLEDGKLVHPDYVNLEDVPPVELTIVVRKWTIKDKYPCPQCGKKLAYPNYLCEADNIKLKPKVQF
jgi:hypothetical protein